MNLFKSTLLLLTIPLYSIAADNSKSDPNTLFMNDEPLELILQLDMEKVLTDKSEDPQYTEAYLIQKLGGDQIHAFNVKMRARGNTRRIESVCEFPPLKINFEKEATGNTVFQGQDKIKLVTHCRESEEFENYAMLEYLAYKTYNILTDYSYRVRLVNIVYKDVKQKYADIEKSGFLIEDNELLAERLEGKITDKKIWSPDSCEENAVDVFSLFQFMIGNTDWWIHTRHNVDILKLKNDDLIPVPFDFDYAGIINTPYATPSAQLPIGEVRERFYKGSCNAVSHFDKTIELFNSKKASIISLLEKADFLERRYRKTSQNYVEDFYKIINSPEKFSKYLDRTCEFVNAIPDKAVSKN